MRLLSLRLSLLALLLVAACSGDDGPPADDGPDAGDVGPDAEPTAEICDNNADDDGDHVVDCGDQDCFLEVYCQPEMVCADGEDNDLDGTIDCADSDCANAPNCLPEGDCTNGADDDLDGLTDCADPDCDLACVVDCADGENLVTLDAAGLPLAIADNATLPIDLPVTADGWITAAAVRFTIQHTYDGDLSLSLTSPGGTVLDLSSNNGGSGDGYIDTVLVDGAATAITAGAAPFTGEYQPEQPFSTLVGAPSAGMWRFAIADGATGDTGSAQAVTLYLCVCDGTDGCEAGLACVDGEDNDGDTLVDCDDVDDCGAALQCQPEVCDDGQDNNGDALVDCADPQCATGALCTAEADCGDGTDDDGDGVADCLDPGCDGVGACELGTETTCTDGIDNDGDGGADCADPDCAGILACAIGACPAGTTLRVYVSTDVPLAFGDNETVLSDIAVAEAGLAAAVAVQVDIDHDYAADVDVRLVAPGGARALSTDNGGSDDDYVGTIFVDTATTSITDGTAPFTGTFQPEESLAALLGTPSAGTWSLEVTDDAGGVTGTVTGFTLAMCACDAAGGECELGAACRNGTDDDGDGVVDCAETSCATDPFCTAEANCANGLDDDLDGTIDCADSDCATGAWCTAEVDCANGLDDDADGAADCLDVGCDGIGACELGTETTCTDGIDNDGDGGADCADPDCSGVWSCAIPSCPTGTSKVFYAATGLPVAIPDNSPTTPAVASIAIPTDGLVTAVAVRLDVTHTFDGDLDIVLAGPGGATVELSTDNGGSGEDYTQTIFTDAATTSITTGTAPFTGAYQPEQPLSGLASTPLDGTWELRVGDDAGSDTGTLNGFELVVCE